MNPQIEILAALATTIEHGVDNGFDRVTFDQEKFAELIIQECVNICLTEADEDLERNRGIWHDATTQIVCRKLANKMKEHFGVE